MQQIVEKPAPGTAPTNNINAGTYVLEPSVVDRIAPGVEVSIERVTFPALVADEALYAMAADTYWLDTGTPEQFLEANLDVVSGRRAADVGPFVRGEVAADASVVESVVGAGCEIGPGARVARSVLFDGCRVEAGAVVSDSVVATSAVIGADARVAAMSVIGAGEQIAPGASLEGERQPAPS